jgi:hypothetical protein
MHPNTNPAKSWFKTICSVPYLNEHSDTASIHDADVSLLSCRDGDEVFEVGLGEGLELGGGGVGDGI